MNNYTAFCHQDPLQYVPLLLLDACIPTAGILYPSNPTVVREEESQWICLKIMDKVQSQHEIKCWKM